MHRGGATEGSMWMETELKTKDELPSGKWVQRVPRSLHAKLIALAKREGSSLNQLATSILAEGVGRSQVPVDKSPVDTENDLA